MKKKLSTLYMSMLLLLVFVALSCSGEGQQQATSQEPSIEGTYKLVSRELPDGTMQGPPDVMGLLTYTKSYRNFNILVRDADGKFLSFSLVSTYKLTASEYSETAIYSITNDEIGGQEINYDLSGSSQSVPVTMEGGRIEIDLPFDPVILVIEGSKVTATAEGMFVDTWEKVE